jgi:hypothetical protein
VNFSPTPFVQSDGHEICAAQPWQSANRNR